ncbi:T9SS type A sorting domain-containing protein [Reichenbachiella versicolor]|uniref:T9SS type A sorting domain-containing protein n=1 Tax=Reichenbachiella versicolor TaxID=1821036 RepID=UPI000D6E1116|nr:T9SS type A sorting domain-containing protein [Reichenbachiella versicolor]
MNKRGVILTLILGVTSYLQAQIVIDVNFDVKHQLGDIDQFDRNKFVAIHADVIEDEWDGDNKIANVREHFLKGYDVYLGRNTGTITWYLNNAVGEDPARKGYANPVDIIANGTSIKNKYINKTDWHAYEDRNDQILAAQLHPFWPDGQEIGSEKWSFSQVDTGEESFGTATGEYMGRYIQATYGNGGASGQPTPKYLEVINEPVWHLFEFGDESLQDIFKFHNGVADAIHDYNQNIKIGGYCTAFPDHEADNFGEWNDRWKAFMDIAGEKMDYWTIHLYDFPALQGKEQYRKGSNMEATFDIMEQYSYMKFNKVKPFMISEYGAQMHDYFGPWSRYRDWLHNKSVNSMMLQFMERADIINKTVNFLPIKAKWGTTSVDNTYNHRLLRMEDEPNALSGQWVYTDMVKVYELWAEVKGTRIDTYSTNLDLMVDGYVEGDIAFVIINNLKFDPVEVSLNALGLETNQVSSVEVKQMFLKNQGTEISRTTGSSIPKTMTLKPEGTIIMKIELSNDVTMNHVSKETKYYAKTYLQEIKSGRPITFSINNVSKGTNGEGILRLGLGRDHGKNLRPIVKFNGEDLYVPANIRGDKQVDRETFFGVLEIEVPNYLIAASNSVEVIFEDDGGHVSSVALQVFEHSRKIKRSEYNDENLSLGIKTSINKKSLDITPNPATNSIEVGFPSRNIHGLLNFKTLDGKTVKTIKVKSGQVEINIADLEAGVYILNMIADGDSYTSKMIVE